MFQIDAESISIGRTVPATSEAEREFDAQTRSGVNPTILHLTKTHGKGIARHDCPNTKALVQTSNVKGAWVIF